VALADLIPQLQKRLSARQTAWQVAWLAAGLLMVMGVSRLAHGEHGHAHEHAEPAHEEHGHKH
jgi:zinc and cadmium transporter